MTSVTRGSPSGEHAGREIAAIALLAALLCIALAWTSRTALNPDGVSYLDMAARMRAGDWSAAVQGYWSPLYPSILAIVGMVGGAEGQAFLTQVHAVNGAIAVGIVVMLWRIARAHGDPIFARGLFAAFLLASARTPRLDAVTPDLLLLAALVGIGGELVMHGGRRAAPLGLWCGAAFLAKTSSWPWLLVSAVVLVVLSKSTRRSTLRATLIAAVVALVWVLPMSLKYGSLTLGSAGRLNACWYLDRCDSRTPDSHSGTHDRQGALSLTDGEVVAIADFTGTPWTYAPWSDPTAWDAGVQSRGRGPLDLLDLFGYWIRQSWAVLSLWTPHLLLGVLLPIAFLAWRPGTIPSGWKEDRAAMLAMLLGIIGVGQFVVVHAEPRLIAPFVMLTAMGALRWWRPPQAPAPTRMAAPWILVLTWLGLAAAFGRGALHARDLADRAASDTSRLARIIAAGARDIPGGLVGRQVVVIGPAIPVVSDAWLLRSPIVAQIPPGSAGRVRRWNAEQQAELLSLLGRGPGEVAWLSSYDGSFQMAVIPHEDK